MSGPVIAVVTALVLLGAAFLLAYIPTIFSWFVGFFKRRGPLGKVLLLVPLIILGAMSFFSVTIVVIIGIVTALSVAVTLRDWWHKGK